MTSTFDSTHDESVCDRVADRLNSCQKLTLPPDLERIERLIDQLGEFSPEPYIIPLSAMIGPGLRQLAK
ncbi:MAG: hypothetical protein FGM32_08585 [Candidatus Kapabacteria bacterium]|nr:hypothetical protein [Candidatus Kapabacteria bacterium]